MKSQFILDNLENEMGEYSFAERWITRQDLFCIIYFYENFRIAWEGIQHLLLHNMPSLNIFLVCFESVGLGGIITVKVILTFSLDKCKRKREISISSEQIILRFRLRNKV